MHDRVGVVDPGQTYGALHSLEQAGLSSKQALGAVTHQFVSQSYLLSTLDLFRISAILYIALIPVIWLARPVRSAAAAGAAAGSGAH